MLHLKRNAPKLHACTHNLVTDLTGILGLAKQTEFSTTKWPPETNYKQLATNQLPVITLHGTKIKHLKQRTLRIRKIHKMLWVFHRQYIHTCTPSCSIQTHKEWDWAWHKVYSNFFAHIQQPHSAQQPKCTFFVTMLLSVCWTQTWTKRRSLGFVSWTLFFRWMYTNAWWQWVKWNPICLWNKTVMMVMWE